MAPKDDHVRMTGFRLASRELDARSFEESCDKFDADQTNKPTWIQVKSTAEEPCGRCILRPTASSACDEHLQNTRSSDRKTSHFQPTLRGQSFGLELGDKSSSQHLHNSDQFQVVWRDLSYQVKLGALHSAAGRLKRLFGSSSTTKSIDDCPSFDPITISSKPEASRAKVASTGDARSRFVFKNLNGYIRSGEIAAILGPSGAGKTSLLKALCGFETRNYGGSIKLLGGGHKKRMQVSIIPQKDYLLENLSVRENLQYSSRILNVSKDFDHEAAIGHVVKVLNLTACTDTLGRNLSGGEYKRVSIAQELLRQPDILVLDEPTSGLDSLNCKKLINTLRDLIDAAHRGTISPIAIVMTIHQPDVDIFSMFDHVYCLAPGGRVVYDGRPGDALEVLRTRGGVVTSSEHQDAAMINPANLLIEIASKATYGDDTIDRLAEYQRGQFREYIDLVDYDNSGAEDPRQKDSRKVAGDEQFYLDNRLDAKSHKKGLFWYHTSLLTKRCFLGSVRDPMVSGLSFTFHLAIPFVMWFVYPLKIGYAASCPKLVRDISILSVVANSTQDTMVDMMDELITSYEGAIMFFVSLWSFCICGTVLSAMAFPLNMHILLKELRNGWYGMSSFVLGKTIASFPIEVLFPVMSLVIMYYILGMPSSYLHWRMIAIAAVMASVAMISTSQGLVFGALFMDDPQTSIFMSVAITLPEALLSGFTARIKNMPEVLQYMSWLNPMRYASDLNQIIRYGFGLCVCGPETEAYLKKPPVFMDLPSQLKPVVNYYLAAMRNSDSYEIDDATTVMPADNSTALERNAYIGNVPGIDYEFVSNSTSGKEILAQIESNRLDIAQVFAKLFSKSLSYGREVNDCRGARSELLAGGGIPPDDWMPYIFAALMGLLLMWKVILYFVVKYKIESYL